MPVEIPRLQALAIEVGVSDDELRELLRRLIREHAPKCATRLATCVVCGEGRLVSERSAQRFRAAGAICSSCRRPVAQPGEREMRSVASLDDETRSTSFAALVALST